MDFNYIPRYETRNTHIEMGQMMRDRHDGEIYIRVNTQQMRAELERMESKLDEVLFVSLTGGEGCTEAGSPFTTQFHDTQHDVRYEKVQQSGVWSLVNADEAPKPIRSASCSACGRPDGECVCH